ncbi:MAG: hypothetical protein GF309_10000 [Candidatus Lokiarchaeota archaeon]|nr:hypothetical protein [Candidatus Lokiarchaeota archaeon]
MLSEDTTPPTWTHELEDEYIECGTSFRYDINASDLSGIDSWWVRDSSYFTVDSTGTVENSSNLLVGVYSICISVNDTAGNVATGWFTLFVVDTTPPEFLEKPSQLVLEYGENLIYQFHAIDLSELDEWCVNDTIHFEVNDGVLVNATPLPSGQYGLLLSVTDIYGNTQSTAFAVIVNPQTTTITTITSTTSTTTTPETTPTTEPQDNENILLIFLGASLIAVLVIVVTIVIRRRGAT